MKPFRRRPRPAPLPDLCPDGQGHEWQDGVSFDATGLGVVEFDWCVRCGKTVTR